MITPRVLLTARPGVGGAARVVESLLRLLPEQGITGTAALSGTESEELLDIATMHRWDVVRVDMARDISLYRDVKALAQLRSLLPGHDLAHAHAAKAGALVRLATTLGRRADVPVIYTPHGFYFTYHLPDTAPYRRYLGLEKRLAPYTTALHCVSEAERQDALAHELATEESAFAIPNAVPQFQPTDTGPIRADERTALGISGVDRVVVMAARLSAPKDPVTFVRAAAHVSEELNAVFVLVGEGELLAEAKAAVGAEGADVIFAPASTNVRSLLRHSRVAVLCSDSEAMPVFLLEALAEGRPVIATDLPGCREAAGEAGQYVPPRDPVALAEAVKRLVQDAPIYSRLSSAAEERAPNFREDIWIERVIDMYQSVLTER